MGLIWAHTFALGEEVKVLLGTFALAPKSLIARVCFEPLDGQHLFAGVFHDFFRAIDHGATSRALLSPQGQALMLFEHRLQRAKVAAEEAPSFRGVVLLHG